VTLGLNYGKDKNSFFAQASRIAGISLDDLEPGIVKLKKMLDRRDKGYEHYRLLGEKLTNPICLRKN